MRKILLVIDMQNDFINGALGTPEAEAIVDRVAEEIAKYPAGDVIATRDTHPENYLETQEGRNLPVVHCVEGTLGWELHPQIAAALKNAVVIDKPTFGSKELAEKLALLMDISPVTAAHITIDADSGSVTVKINPLWEKLRTEREISLPARQTASRRSRFFNHKNQPDR